MNSLRSATMGLLLGVLSLTPAQASDKSAAEADCAEAEASRRRSAELNYEWTTIQPLLTRAGEALARGDHGQAAALCQEAKLQAELALQQATHEARAWQENIPR